MKNLPKFFLLFFLVFTHLTFAKDKDAERKLINTPAYIKIIDGQPHMQIAVINRSKLIKKDFLNKVLNTVKEQVEDHFAPYYGIFVDYHIFHNENEVNWNKFVPMIIPNILVTDPGAGTIAFHDLQQPVSSPIITGDPISHWLFNPPNLPDGTPYIIIPIGTENTDYGVLSVHLQHIPFFPPTFAGLFSLAVSHETLETLHNYTTGLFTAINPTNQLNFFSNECCDPVELAKGYKLHGVFVSNFVLPSYWQQLAKGPFDFLKTVPAPLTPFAGEQQVFQFGCTEHENIFLVSFPQPIGNPNEVVTIDGGSLFNCPPSNSKNGNPIRNLRVFRSTPLKKGT